MGRLTGKVAIISGAARGIGQSVAETFHAEGATVLAGDILPPSSPSDGVDWTELDVAQEDAWRTVVDRVEADYGRLDVLVNNAGISPDPPLILAGGELWLAGCGAAADMSRGQG